MKPLYSLGLDVAKRKVDYELLDAQRRRVAGGLLAAKPAELRRLLQRLKAVGTASQIVVVIEATGLLHLPWAEALTQGGYSVMVLNPLLSKRIYSTANAIRDSKSDRIDAHGLAEIGLLHRDQLDRFRYRPEPARFAVQRLQTVRQQLRAALTNQKRALVGLLDLVFPELADLVNVNTVGVRRLLAEAATPEAIRRLSWRRLQGAFGAQAQEVLNAARDSLVPAALATASVPAVQALLASIELLERQIAGLDAELTARLAAAVEPQQIALARTVPGLGKKTAVAVLAQIPQTLWRGGGRKKIAARLQALMGNDPRVQESGAWKGKTRMSKRGNRSLRTAMYQAAFCATVHDKQIRSYYQRKRAAGKPHKVAISHVMRILTRRLVAVMMSGKPYQVLCAQPA